MSTHTPGEWKWDEPRNWLGTAARVYHESGEKYEPIAQVQISGWSRKIALANATLIAAAPDLLAACIEVEKQRISQEYGRGGTDAPGHSHEVPGIWDSDNGEGIAGTICKWCAAWNQLRASIAKATRQ